MLVQTEGASNDGMFLSVIIPCYNASKTIEDTLDNLTAELNGTCHYEIIVVDDGSTDNSVTIAEAKAKQCSCLRVLTKTNGGVSDARNYGLKRAHGEYVWFFDADDLLFECTVKEIVAIIRNSQPDKCNFWSVTVDWHEKKNIDSRSNIHNFEILFDGKLKDWGKDKNIPFSCWSCFVKRSLLIEHSIEFNTELSIVEDVLWNLDIARKCPDAHFVECNLRVVKYMVHSGSVVNAVNSIAARKQLDSYLEYGSILKSFRNRCPGYLSVAVEALYSDLARKLVTRFLASKTSVRESKSIIQEIQMLINVNGGGYLRLLKYPILIPVMQLLYRNIFLRLIKPYIARN